MGKLDREQGMGQKKQPQCAWNPALFQGISEDIWRKIQRLRLMDDLLMRVALADNKPAVELILRIIMGKPDLIVTDVTAQAELKLLLSRGLRLDIKAKDSEERLYNIEVQRDSGGAHPKRARYHSALLDTEFLKEGEDTQTLPETVLIFITETDYFKTGLPTYHIVRTIRETGEEFGDSMSIIYCNGAYVGRDEQDAMGNLMADFRASDPDRMHYPILADSVRKIKWNPEGVTEMSSVMDEFRKEWYQDGFGEGHDAGFGEGLAEGCDKTNLAVAGKMMKVFGYTLEQALNFLEISADKKSEYAERLRQEQERERNALATVGAFA